ncbi:MAG: transcription termination factor NusA [Candidatus Calescibacterium sp.]|nr:transcription termination factor NusA [Candidatus Calescibacterium sp.]
MAAKKKELKIEEGEPEPLKVTLKALAEERGISMSTLIQTMKDILSQTAKEILGDAEYIVEFDEEKSEFRIYRKKTVVEKVNNPLTEISLEEARKIDPTAEVGDEAYEVIDTKSMGRRGTQVARNLLMARLSGAVEESIYQEFSKKKGQLVAGIVKKIEFERIRKEKIIYVDLGKNVLGILPQSELAPQDSKLREGDTVRAVIKDVRIKHEGMFTRTEVILSRIDKKFVEEIVKKNVSEVEQGIIKIRNIARKPGFRVKILVESVDSNIDPVGACVGVRGIRIKSMVQELGGERIDIIPYSENIQQLITNALGIRKVSAIMVRKTEGEQKEAIVVVPDDELSIAIGRGGLNVKLASELLGIKINVRSESEREKLREMLPDFFKSLGIGEKQMQIIWESGFRTIEDIALAPFEKIKEIPGLSEAEAKRIFQEARRIFFEKLKEEEKIKGVEKAKIEEVKGEGAEGGT